MTLWHELDSPLMQRALVEAVLVGALCGAVGAHVLVRRLPFFTLALSHATLPGVVIASIVGSRRPKSPSRIIGSATPTIGHHVTDRVGLAAGR